MTEDAFLLAIERRAIIYEIFGVFWLVAEALILAGVVLARRHLERSPASATLQWDRAARWLVMGLGGVATLGGGLLLARHGLLPSASVRYASLGSVDPGVIEIMVLRQREHLFVWSTMVVLWVVLESAIVYQGWRAYQVLAGLLPPPPRNTTGKATAGNFVVVLGALAFPALAAGAATASVTSGLDGSAALQAAYGAEEPLRSVAYLVIRVAAMAWIIVEWIAAIYLWKGSRRILFAARRLS